MRLICIIIACFGLTGCELLGKQYDSIGECVQSIAGQHPSSELLNKAKMECLRLKKEDRGKFSDKYWTSWNKKEHYYLQCKNDLKTFDSFCENIRRE